MNIFPVNREKPSENIGFFLKNLVEQKYGTLFYGKPEGHFTTTDPFHRKIKLDSARLHPEGHPAETAILYRVVATATFLAVLFPPPTKRAPFSSAVNEVTGTGVEGLNYNTERWRGWGVLLVAAGGGDLPGSVMSDWHAADNSMNLQPFKNEVPQLVPVAEENPRYGRRTNKDGQDTLCGNRAEQLAK
ncbi:hypothetical protein J6590_047125 [Homalodisca vitripennis]|nr:hypothetical protein J6590_047125 [Homalodisca vitripennis]